ncbi:hypothetical protein K239x_54140 [Planctomycetes bacterium K23_9]|uniref:Uncharacterized protein n=1 Tax=Stieleria marina TaxID=1930275 RepID=A0A517P1Y8_9BACT|nr:hypothetical protein K239x_54140 [Planctomycetes bacterium K23_9]
MQTDFAGLRRRQSTVLSSLGDEPRCEMVNVSGQFYSPSMQDSSAHNSASDSGLSVCNGSNVSPSQVAISSANGLTLQTGSRST